MMFEKTINCEIQDNRYLLEQIDDPFIRSRAESCLKWYITKAVTNKYYFYLLSGMTIICPIISSVILNFPNDSIIIKVLSSIFMGISTIAASFLTMLDTRKKWGIYRNQAEILKSMLSKHQYKQEDEADLVQQMEESMAKTHEQWIKPFENSK